MEYKVAELFTSINGEGARAGQLAVFVRFCGCNLNCSYCDTRWANEKDAKHRLMTGEMIIDEIKKSGVKNVTLTGGEPLEQLGIEDLIRCLAKDENFRVEIETNGSIDLSPYDNMPNRPAMTMDYKLPSSNMEKAMNLENMRHIKQQDTVKFVCGDIQDLEKAYQIIDRYSLAGRCHVYLSPVYGKMNPQDMVEFIKSKRMNDINIQLQMHKFIWEPDERGV